jgi:hypothetical protein
LVGEAGCDYILGGKGKDKIDATDNDDCTNPLDSVSGEFVRAGPSNDQIFADDDKPDIIDCGGVAMTQRMWINPPSAPAASTKFPRTARISLNV